MADFASDEVPLTPASPPPRRGSLIGRILKIGLVSLIALAGVGGGIAMFVGLLPNPFHAHPAAHAESAPANSEERLVKTVRPKRAAAIPITVENIATVEPYYRADLRARSSGIVRTVRRDIGDKVRAGEVLIEIDLPEADQEVARADAMILQREQELKVSVAKLKDAQAAVRVAAAGVKQKKADVEGATATRDLKKGRFERFRELAKTGSVVGNAVYEEERDYLASEAAVSSANANVERAQADYSESESKVEAAAADIDLKKAQIAVARKEHERAKAIADYGRVTAPFDGVVVRRTVDPGSFVQNATTGVSEPLISVARVDLVTVVTRLPDSVAPFIAVGTEVRISVGDIPGAAIASRVCRFAPSVQNADRTMRVEVDLFNGDDDEYRRLEAGMKGPGRSTKGANDPMPDRAFPAGTKTHRLIPGMTGKMRLTVGGFGESFVLPSTAVYSRSGVSYVLLVEKGKTRQVPVRVQVNDGVTVRVALVEKKADADGNLREVLTELTGQEVIITARQQELGDGASVTASPTEW